MGRITQIDRQGNETHIDFPPFGPRDPLDHDGDGKKGGSRPGRKTRRASQAKKHKN